MSRKEPTMNVPEVTKTDQPNNGKIMVTEVRKYKLITPLYGGGEKPAHPDSVTVVRATEVRGHLRFWWRATRGGQFGGDLKKMQEREEQIWGSSGEKGKPGPSKVIVYVGKWSSGREKTYDEKPDNRGNKVHIAQMGARWSYVAFPLRENKSAVWEDVSFELEITYPHKIAEEVEAALWAWEVFGGLGARTRRGFGAFLRMDVSSLVPLQRVNQEIRDGLKKHIAGEHWPKGVPHLVDTLNFQTAQKNDPIAAWEYLFRQLQQFRQDRYAGSTSRFGRSKWSEPDAIRRLPGMTASASHSRPRNMVDKFPRAKFGLPIIFKFKDDKVGDPRQTSLEGIESDRLASPLILRPIQCSDGAVGLAAILEWEPINAEDEKYTPPGGLQLKGAPGDPKVTSALAASEAAQIPPLNGETDVLQAFLKTLK